MMAARETCLDSSPWDLDPTMSDPMNEGKSPGHPSSPHASAASPPHQTLGSGFCGAGVPVVQHSYFNIGRVQLALLPCERKRKVLYGIMPFRLRTNAHAVDRAVILLPMNTTRIPMTRTAKNAAARVTLLS